MRKRYAADFLVFITGKYDNSVEEFMNPADIREIIEESISELPNRRQMAFRLSRTDFMPIPEIAQKMNISTRTVEKLFIAGTAAFTHTRWENSWRSWYGLTCGIRPRQGALRFVQPQLPVAKADP